MANSEPVAAHGEQLTLRGIIKGHNDWVTAIATSPVLDTTGQPDKILTASRDRSCLVSQVTREEPAKYGESKRRLKGHHHFVSDIAISSDGQFALSGSWDNTLRLWDLNTGATTRRFVGHSKDVLSVAFSADNRKIVSSSRDKSIRLWNTLGQQKGIMEPENAHTDWVSCVRFSPLPNNPSIVSAGWDKVVKVWDSNSCKLITNLTGHTGYINTVTVSPDGSLCASGGKDGTAMLWDLNEGKHLYSLEAGDIIHSLCFSPTSYWLCAGTNSCIRIWDLETKQVVCELNKSYPDFWLNNPSATEKTPNPACLSLCWSADGRTLYAGYSDNVVRVWGL